ncbi:hypothetical protein IU487_22245 [Nocardia puris]|uniref:hypothetical protein n=1 Tax=Nocardia puris TaxID=208602 RepID=UPI0018956BF9|nr:hypothetical protein [Nocardia puris]MBF6213741.1 hypothetical protein [Nocardia puris]
MDGENAAKADMLRGIAADRELLRIAHCKIQDALIEFRDRRISLPGRGNGLVVREANGEESSMIRMSVQDAVRLAINAIADELAGRDTDETEKP